MRHQYKNRVASVTTTRGSLYPVWLDRVKGIVQYGFAQSQLNHTVMQTRNGYTTYG